MNLAEATGALSKKGSEKTAVSEEIQTLEDLRDEGYVAILHASVYGVHSSSDHSEFAFAHHLHQQDGAPPATIVTDKALNDAVRINLTAKDGKIVIMGTSAVTIDSEDLEAEPVVKKARYSMELAISEIPEDGELRADFTAEKVIEEGAECDQPASITYKLKLSVDDIGQLLQSKNLELEQLDAEFREIAAQVQEAKKRQTAKSAGTKATAKKGTKKTKAPVRQTEVDESTETAEPEVPQQGPSYLAQATDALFTVGNLAIEKRAYILFGVTAALIHLYGDYASV